MERLSLGSITERIESAVDFKTLRTLREQAVAVLPAEFPFSDPKAFNTAVNELHDRIMRKTALLAEAALSSDPDWGSPPVPYAFMLFGSGGREERTLWSDQDHGIVYDTPASGREGLCRSYFAALAGFIVEGLQETGYPPCDGEVLCTNPQWRKALSEWREMLRDWMDEAAWEPIRYLLIAADMRCLYGQERLVDELRAEVLDYAGNSDTVLKAMLKNTLHRKVSLGVFGQIITERYGEHAGGVDIKYGAYIPLVNAVRLLAVKAGVAASSSLDRIDGLVRTGAVAAELAEEWKYAFALALKLRALVPGDPVEGVYSSSGILPGKAITGECKLELKYVLHTGKDMHKYVTKLIEAQ